MIPRFCYHPALGSVGPWDPWVRAVSVP
jgi:hypothetical protein